MLQRYFIQINTPDEYRRKATKHGRKAVSGENQKQPRKEGKENEGEQW